MNVLGPYRFLAEGEDGDECNCGRARPSPLKIGDRITFQIPASESCCGDEESYQGGTEIQENFTIAEGVDETVNESGLCLAAEAFNGTFISKEMDVEAGIKYTICFCITNNTTEADLKVIFNGSTMQESTAFTGSGNFCFTFVADATETITFGIKTDAETDLALCVDCATICITKTWTANLLIGNTQIPLTVTDAPNGNSVVNYLTTGELAEGCYTIELTNDCDSEVLVSNEINLRTNWACSLLLRWRDDKNVFGFDYTDENYYNEYRNKGMLKNSSYPTSKTVKTLSNNTSKQANAMQSKKILVQFEDTPEFVMDAVAKSTIHQQFFINGTQYVADEQDIVPNWRKGNQNAATIAFEVIDQSYDGINNLC